MAGGPRCTRCPCPCRLAGFLCLPASSPGIPFCCCEDLWESSHPSNARFSRSMSEHECGASAARSIDQTGKKPGPPGISFHSAGRDYVPSAPPVSTIGAIEPPPQGYSSSMYAWSYKSVGLGRVRICFASTTDRARRIRPAHSIRGPRRQARRSEGLDQNCRLWKEASPSEVQSSMWA